MLTIENNLNRNYKLTTLEILLYILYIGNLITNVKNRDENRWIRRVNSYDDHASNSLLKRRQYSATVLVKNVFRGNEKLQNQNVIIEGLGNKKFCVSRPRLKDTRVFLLNSVKARLYTKRVSSLHHFRLRSSLLRPTKENIKILSNLGKEQAW